MTGRCNFMTATSFIVNHPSNPDANGLRDLKKIKGVEVQLSMHEMYDTDKKPIKQRNFVTRIYSRILNAKFD